MTVMMMLVVVLVVCVRMFMLTFMLMMMGVLMSMRHAGGVGMLVKMFVGKVYIELDAFNRGLMRAPDVEVESIQAKFLQLMFELMKINAEVEQRANQHVAADSAENIQIKRLHCFCARALIWRAA